MSKNATTVKLVRAGAFAICEYETNAACANVCDLCVGQSEAVLKRLEELGYAVVPRDEIARLKKALNKIACTSYPSECLCDDKTECSYGIARAALYGENWHGLR